MHVIRPDGKLVFIDTLLPYFQVLPFADILFQDYLFSGIMLIIINGITNIIFSILIIKKQKNRDYLSNHIWIRSDDVNHYSVCYLSIIHNQSSLFFSLSFSISSVISLLYHTINFSLNSMKKIIQTSEKKQILLWFFSGVVDLKCTAKE